MIYRGYHDAEDYRKAQPKDEPDNTPDILKLAERMLIYEKTVPEDVAMRLTSELAKQIGEVARLTRINEELREKLRKKDD